MWKLWVALPLVSVFLIIFIVYNVIFSLKNKKKQTKGFNFEAQINEKMMNIAKARGIKYIKGGLFKYASNQMFEIDGVLIGNKAIYIIEVKYYIGHLTGDSFAETLELRNSKKVVKIKNPLLQNFKHIQHFYKLCNFSLPVFSLLVLPSEASYDIDQLDSWSIITTEDKINEKLDEVAADLNDEPNLSFQDAKTVCDILNLSRATSIKDIKRFGKIIHGN